MSQKVLIVEDDANQRLLYEEELREEGYEIHSAGDGRAALRIAHENTPDIVILDINMPGLDGLDTLSQLLETNPSLPVIINTAYPGYQDSFTTWSADAYIVKSSDLSELKATIKKLLHADAATGE